MLLLSFLMGAMGGALATGLLSVITRKAHPNSSAPTQQELIQEFYAVETAVHVSPHGLRKQMARGADSFILVDLRSQEEYEREHIIGAINIPAYKTPDKSAYGDVERIVAEFAKLPQDKDIIVYCYSIPCMTGRKVGKMLSERGIFVQHLGIGWNEWRYHWNLWNHEHEWQQTKVEDYIAKGKEPGKINPNFNPNACPLEGDFGC